MRFSLDAIHIEDSARTSVLARRVVAALPPQVPIDYVTDGREFTRPAANAGDSFGMENAR